MTPAGYLKHKGWGLSMYHSLRMKVYQLFAILWSDRDEISGNNSSGFRFVID